jgi:hypothetical protein
VIADVAIKPLHPRDPQLRRQEDEITALLSAEVDEAGTVGFGPPLNEAARL